MEAIEIVAFNVETCDAEGSIRRLVVVTGEDRITGACQLTDMPTIKAGKLFPGLDGFVHPKDDVLWLVTDQGVRVIGRS